MLAKRSIIEILHEILKMEGRKKTHIQYQAALTYPQVNRYLQGLSARGLMEMEQDDRGGNIYRVTDKGKELSKHLSLVMGFLELRDSDEA